MLCHSLTLDDNSPSRIAGACFHPSPFIGDRRHADPTVFVPIHLEVLECAPPEPVRDKHPFAADGGSSKTTTLYLRAQHIFIQD